MSPGAAQVLRFRRSMPWFATEYRFYAPSACLVPARGYEWHEMASACYPKTSVGCILHVEERVILRSSSVWSMKICISPRDVVGTNDSLKSQPLPLVLPEQRTLPAFDPLLGGFARHMSLRSQRPCMRHSYPAETTHRHHSFGSTTNPAVSTHTRSRPYPVFWPRNGTHPPSPTTGTAFQRTIAPHQERYPHTSAIWCPMM